MWRRRLFWKLTLTFSAVIVVSMAGVGGYLVHGQRGTTRRLMEDHLARVAQVVDDRFGNLLDLAQRTRADSLASHIGRETATRITIIASDGRVLADTEGNPERMDNHRLRPEVQSALRGRVGSSLRFSDTVRQDFLYVAVPSKKRLGWVVRVAVPATQFQRNVRDASNVLLLGTVMATAIAILLAAFLTRRITQPLDAMRAKLQQLERGEFGVRLEPGGDDEVGMLARTLNSAQDRLEHTIQGLTSQRNQRDAILASMVEGLLAVDADERVLLMNRSAGRLLAVESDQAEGRALVEVVRSPDLLRFVQKTREAREPVSAEIVLRERGPMWLELHGAPLGMADAAPQGAVVVFNDVTRLQKLEQARKDFVGNVSHELRTPVTSIKGFLETLLHRGALEDSDTARRFLGIIAKHTDRLSAIIDDLLYLSRLEHEGDPVPKQTVRLASLIESAVADFTHLAEERGVRLVAHADPNACVHGDASLLRRALDNLIDNAIKYSPRESCVEVHGIAEEDAVVLRVVDEGAGIPEEHLPRISERFYRVDAGRSRELGGTGLGLAIVKHVARVHGGELHIQSVVGEGSCFDLQLPVAAVAPQGIDPELSEGSAR